MALRSPMMPSPSTLPAGFSPYTASPSSPAPFHNVTSPRTKRSSGHSTNSDSLHPPPSPYPLTVDPSPVDSNGTASTDTTDIDDDAQDAAPEHAQTPLKTGSVDPSSAEPSLGKIDTSLASRTRSDSEIDTGPQSVIHVPGGFHSFNDQNRVPKSSHVTTSPSPTDKSETTVVSPSSPEASFTANARPGSMASALNSDVSPGVATSERRTSRAQTREVGEEESKRRSRHSLTLDGDIPELQNIEDDSMSGTPIRLAGSDDRETQISEETTQNITSLRVALNEMWMLCNTLAGLSSNHRARIFSYRETGVVQQQAWRSCWKLCQNLYNSRDEDHASQVNPTLDLCRDFLHALFEARQKGDETADSVLRTAFDLNNHLYSNRDLNAPSQVQERTLEFYFTLCNRLMRQRTSLPDETDALLQVCWSLAARLYNIRKRNRESKPADEELLAPAVQACWELCDLFREGWTQIRPDRSTPRPNQTSFRPYETYSNHSSPPLARSSSTSSYQDLPASFPPETPTTIFDDTNDNVDDGDDVNVPNILVLGPEVSSSSSHFNRWSSSASTLSGYSESQRSSSTIGMTNADTHLPRIRILLVKAAMTAGFQLRNPIPSIGSSYMSEQHHQPQHHVQQNQNLLAFVKAMPSNSFGPHSWQTTLLDKYRKLVAGWPAIARSLGGDDGHLLVGTTRRVTAAEIARGVQWITRSEHYAWLTDLFRVVFGCFPDDAMGMTGTIVQA